MSRSLADIMKAYGQQSQQPDTSNQQSTQEPSMGSTETETSTSGQYQALAPSIQSIRSPLQTVVANWLENSKLGDIDSIINMTQNFTRVLPAIGPLAQLKGFAENVGQLREVIDDPDKLHYALYMVVAQLQKGLNDDHRSGYGGPGRCQCFAAPEGGEESSEGVSGGSNGNGQEHFDGGTGERVQESVQPPEAAGHDAYIGLEA